MLQKPIDKNVIFILSYNPDPKHRGERTVNGCRIIPLPCAFNETGRNEDKCKDNVREDDKQLQLLLQYFRAGQMYHALPFAGKAYPETVHIILLLKRLFEGYEHMFTWVSCHHDRREKHRILHACGFKNIRDFTDERALADPKHQCDEWDELWKVATEIAQKKGK